MKKLMFGLMLLAMCFNSACSRLDLAFRNADMFLAFKVDDYFDITSVQKKNLKATFKQDLERLRKNKLPEVSAQLKKVDQELGSDKLDEARLAHFIQYSWSTYEDALAEFTATTDGLVESLRSEQLNYFMRVSKKKIDEDKETLSDPRDFLKKRRKTYSRVLDMFFGDLNSTQRELLDQHIRQTTYFHELKLKNRQEFLDKLQGKRNSLEAQRALVKSFYLGTAPKSADLARGEKQFEKDLEFFLGKLIQSLSPSQKAKLKANILDKARQLDRLSS